MVRCRGPCGRHGNGASDLNLIPAHHSASLAAAAAATHSRRYRSHGHAAARYNVPPMPCSLSLSLSLTHTDILYEVKSSTHDILVIIIDIALHTIE